MKAQREDFPTIFPEWVQMIGPHWAEVKDDLDIFGLDPDLGLYMGLHATGKLYVATIRQNGELAGYFLAIIGTTLHNRNCLTAQMDAIYVHPRFRGGSAIRRLLRFVLADLTSIGMQRVIGGTRLQRDISRLFRAFGFKPTEIAYTRLLEA